jgi:hypothetical protein
VISLKISANIGVLVGLCAISMSTLIVEICLTKFLGIKLFYHFAYALLSMVVFSMALAGTYIYLKKGPLGEDTSEAWQQCSTAALLYAVSLPLAVAVFCWTPLNPLPTSGDILQVLSFVALPIYMVLLGIPLALAGVCISHTLSACKLPVTVIYFWDLLAAAVGAALCPLILEKAGGYGAICIASLIGLVGAIAFQHASGKMPGVKNGVYWFSSAAVAALLLSYPSWAISTYGFDIRSPKEIGTITTFQKDFSGVTATHWNAVGRVDVSDFGTSESMGFFRFGLSSKANVPKLYGRMIMVDGAANTRQFRVDGKLADQHFLKQFLWASPYVAYGDHPQRSLVIGGGGGVDILIAKYFNIPKVDVLEFNPANAAILKGEIDDAKSLYTPWLLGDSKTEVNIINKEARHYCTTQPPGTYDIIQASGVDTLTAITTGGLALSDSYLYTKEAVADYSRLLRQDGILSLTHWRLLPPVLPLRMFLTYLEYLDDMGVKQPWRNLLIVSTDYWTDCMVKTTPFTQEQVQAVHAWAKESRQEVLFDPFLAQSEIAKINTKDKVFYDMAYADSAKRKDLINAYEKEVTPVTDDKPYFYKFEKLNQYLELTSSALVVFALIVAGLIVALPIGRMPRRDMRAEIIPYILFFACCGFAFFLFETMIIQMLSIVVGGPIYALSVVLVCVLAGYAVGSFFAQYLKPTPTTIGLLGVILCLVFVGLAVTIHPIIHAILPLSLPWRIFVCAVVTTLVAFVTGVPVSLTMQHLREKWGSIVAWMWGISSASNGLGAISFVPIARIIGISHIGYIIAALYLLGAIALWVGLKLGARQNDVESPPVDGSP